MYNYRLVLSVKNSAGNELHKSWNFTCNIAEHCTLYRILGALHKEGYHHLLHDGWKNYKNNTPIAFDQLCKELHEFRFYETKICSHEKITHAWEYVTDLRFPCEVFVKWFNSEWGGTFFEISFEDKSLVRADFDSIKAHLEKYDIDLFKSKTEGLWYSHKFLELTNLKTYILIRRRNTIHEWVNDTEKIEL